MIPDNILLAALKKNKIFDEAAIKNITAEAKASSQAIEDFILSHRLINEEQLLALKSEILKLPVKKFEKDEKIDQQILNLIPEDTARQFYLLAFGRAGNTVLVGMVYPEDVRAQDALKFVMNRQNLNFKVYLISPSDHSRFLKDYSTLSQQLAQLLLEFQRKYPQKLKGKAGGAQLVDLESSGLALVEEAPVIRLLSLILNYAVRNRASDIHIEPRRENLRVRLRIDGELFTAIILPLEIHAPIISRLKVMTNLKIDETRIPQDGRFRTIVDGREIDYRLSTFPTAFGEKVAIRILDPTVGLKNLEDLGLSPHNLEILKRAMDRPFGMILISGPTGSGKSTTLYAMIQKMNKDGVNIVSLEDPVEYSIEGINQSQVLPEIGYTFGRGLRQILRQDPDIILVGEIRDSETAELAVHAALTGHIVLSTLHTNNAIGVAPRLIDLGVQPFLLPSALNLMMAQRLVRRLCPHCRQKVTAPPELEKIIDEAVSTLPPEIKNTLPLKKPYEIYEPKGCPECKGKGYIGRVAIFEMLEMTPELEKIILGRLPESEFLEEAKRQKMITLRQDGIIKVLSGLTSLAEVLKET